MEAIREERVLAALAEVPEPEIGISIVDLGLIYGIDISGGNIHVRMTMTTPACPLHAHLRQAVDEAVRRHLPDVNSVLVELVCEPPWHPMLISPQARRYAQGSHGENAILNRNLHTISPREIDLEQVVWRHLLAVGFQFQAVATTIRT